MKILKAIVVVPWWKHERLSKIKQRDDIVLIHPYSTLPGNKAHIVMLDRDLQNEWDEFMDDWFYAEIVPLAANKEALKWCSEIDNAKT